MNRMTSVELHDAAYWLVLTPLKEQIKNLLDYGYSEDDAGDLLEAAFLGAVREHDDAKRRAEAGH